MKMMKIEIKIVPFLFPNRATDSSSRSIPTQMVVTPLRVETPHSPRQPTNPNPILNSMGEVKGVEVDHHHPSKDQATNGKSVMTALQR